MKHPTSEQLQPLLNAVDTAVWCLAVKDQTRKGLRCKIDWKSALKELEDAWYKYQITTDDKVLVLGVGLRTLRYWEIKFGHRLQTKRTTKNGRPKKRVNGFTRSYGT